MKREVRPGDIILYPANGRSAWSSRLVVAGEVLAGFGGGLEQYSHAAILDHGGWQYEATFPRVCRSRIDVARGYEVWRVGNPTGEQRRAILRWCRSKVGCWYNLVGVFTADHLRLPNTFYCSEFDGTAYWEAARIKIGDDIFSPDSIPDTDGARMLARYAPETR